MTVLALRHAAHVNGVAALHGRVSREMWKAVYGVANAKDVPIGHVTNGVHPRTWLHPEAETFWRRQIGLDLDDATPAVSRWADAKDAAPEDFWNAPDSHCGASSSTSSASVRSWSRRQESGATALNGLAQALSTLRDDALTIGFARRFATYKRAPLIFRDLMRRLTESPRRRRAAGPDRLRRQGPPARSSGGQDYARSRSTR
jgi:starch phosphorylase